MKTIKDILALPPNRLTEGLYGVEIEVEGNSLPFPGDVDESVWRVERDGSLKTEEAWEYVMPKPLNLEGVRDALDYLDDLYEENESNVHDSVRAGVHVHMNVQKYNIIDLLTFAMCYYLVEDTLLEWCGPSRSGNLFTLRTRDAEYNLVCLYRALVNKNLRYLHTENIRYSSLNFLSLFKYGSLEFRGMRGTRDLNEIYKWVEIINDLREGASTFRNAADVLMSMSGEGELEFIKRVLPNTYQYLNLSDNTIRSVRDAARRVQMIAFEIDWDSLVDASNNNIFIQQEGGF